MNVVLLPDGKYAAVAHGVDIYEEAVRLGGIAVPVEELLESEPTVDEVEATIAARRYEEEVGGITINGLQINTDDRSKLLINGAALEATIDPSYTMQWKTQDGFVELNSQQVIAIARAVRAHVQACFDREAELLAHLEAGTFTEDMLEEGWPS